MEAASRLARRPLLSGNIGHGANDMTKTVYLNERDDDKNDGLTPETAVLSGNLSNRCTVSIEGTAIGVVG